MNFTLKIWRQKNQKDAGRFESYEVLNVSPDASFLEMLDVLNNQLVLESRDPVAYDHDCREGICGSCGLMINGRAHGPGRKQAMCDVRMRTFKDGQELVVEPWRAKPFPVIKDLVVDRTAMDRIMQAGGYISVRTGGTPDANSINVMKANAEEAMDAAACIGCGACVAACPNSSAMLFRNLHCCRRDKLSERNACKKWLHRWIRKASAIALTIMPVRQNARKEWK
jgi:succinate dehydrogenase / fumarate reductase iron-sulfur subunit